MQPLFVVLKEERGEWKQDETFGYFQHKIDADEKVFLKIEYKPDFWTKYKVVQIEK
jgi:hypothetical protein